MADLTEEQKRRVRMWVEALRSGRHEQVQGALTDGENGRCCLGVACEVYKKETGRGIWYRLIKVFEAADGTEDGGLMPRGVADWFGLRQDPFMEARPIKATFANDVLGYNFDQIADAIEKRYLQ